MFDETIKRLNDTKNRLECIFELCDEYGGIIKALKNYKVAQPAIIMHLIVCKENIEKILFNGEDISGIFSREDLRGLSAIRNIAAHDYDGLNFTIIESVIRDYLPPIKEKIHKFLEQNKEIECKPSKNKDIER